MNEPLFSKEKTQYSMDGSRLMSNDLVTSVQFRAMMLEAAALDLIWGPWGPMKKRLSRIAGAVGKNGEQTEFTDGVIDSLEKLNRFIEKIEDLRPQSTNQLHGLKIGEHVHPNASLDDLVVLRWQERTRAELEADREKIASEIKFWSGRQDLSIFDFSLATSRERFRETRSHPTHLKQLVTSRKEAMHQPVNESNSCIESESSEIQAIIKTTIEAFPQVDFSEKFSKLVVIPTTIAAALADNEASIYAELGVREVTPEIITKLATAKRLQKDRGVYETISSAWEAALKL